MRQGNYTNRILLQRVRPVILSRKKAMLVTIFCAPRDRPETTFALDVSPELELRDFVALCELESGIPAGEIQVRPRQASCGSREANGAN